MLRNLTLLSLVTHLVSLAATQTAFGDSFSLLRWIALFAFAVFGAVAWVASPQRHLRLLSVNARVAIYAALWGLTVIYSAYPLFSSFRWLSHLMIVVSSLVFLPQLLRVSDASRALVALKLIVGVILVVSYFRPAPMTAFDDPGLYKGIFGNPNALGHMAAVGCLLFFHGYLTGKDTRWGKVQAGLAVLAAMLMIQSGARSSACAFLAGFFVLYLLYKERLSRYLVVGLLVSLGFVAVAPGVAQRVSTFAFKQRANVEDAGAFDRLTFSRQSVWEKSWEGFKEHPFLGWGFGIDSDADLSEWTGQLTALGFSTRDPVNDVLYSLETGGIFGLAAYLSLAALAFKAWFPGPLRSKLDSELKQVDGGRIARLYETQKLFFCLTVQLFVLFEFDNTALSAGNFFAALFWVSFGITVGLHAVLMAGLRRAALVRSGVPRPAPAQFSADNRFVRSRPV